jgi:integrase
VPRKPKAPPKPPRRPRGSGSIAVLASGVIRARLPASVDPKRPAREFRAGQMAEAVAWLDAALQPRPASVEVSTVTVADWGDSWHQTYVVPLGAPNTARWYLYALKQLAPLYGAPLVDVRQSALQAIVGQMSARLDATTVQAIVGVWRRCLDAAVDDELIARNPARRLALPRSTPHVVKRHVTPGEVAALWPAIEGHRFEAAYALLLGCGLRIGEVLGLSWADVDLAGSRAWIQRQWTNSHWRELPKNRTARWAGLPSRVVAALIRHRNNQPTGAVYVMQSPHSDWFGPGKRGRRAAEVRPWAAQTVVRDLAALIDATPHAFRRGLVTALLDGGASPAIVAERVGHASPTTTLKFYAGKSTEANLQAARIIDQYLGGSVDMAPPLSENDSGDEGLGDSEP